MKAILEYLMNLFLFLIGTWYQFIPLLWYGKLPKVSIYHMWKLPEEWYKIFNDKTYQGSELKFVSKEAKKTIIYEYIELLYKNEAFKEYIAALAIPMFNGKEVYGHGNVNSEIFRPVLKEYIKTIE